jgi:hypothetical protein
LCLQLALAASAVQGSGQSERGRRPAVQFNPSSGEVR